MTIIVKEKGIVMIVMGTMVTAIRLAVLLHRIRRDGARRRETRHDRLSPCMCPGTVSHCVRAPRVGAPALLHADLKLTFLSVGRAGAGAGAGDNKPRG